MSAESVRQAFRQLYQADPTVFSAPGRINLIGDHTDYNDGFVLPMAIDFHTWVAVSPRLDRKLVVRSACQPESAWLDLDSPLAPRRTWSDYVFGVALLLEQAGLRLLGADMYLEGDIPLGAGLSSSASLEVAVCEALMTVGGHEVRPVAVARLCQRAENEYVGVRCGIMDQFTVAHRQMARALLLDCRSLEWRSVPLIPGTRLVICNSRVHHELAGSEYNLRRQQCEQGVAILQRHRPTIKALRDVTLADLNDGIDEISDIVLRRCRHVVTENHRVGEAAEALTRQDAGVFGRLMQASHRSLQLDYQVSCPELDRLVELALAVPGVWGARMTGGGFGGCTVNLVDADAAERLRDTILAGYHGPTGQTAQVYIVS